jgi:DtxR family Mn-dependent transcriptional regulator
MKLTVSKEDYLKAIAEAGAEEGAVIAAIIARWLQVSAPAVALALRRLRRDKLVTVDRKGRISLTAAGRGIADKLRLRHHLVERMLHELLGIEWYKVHDEAERLEHAISDDVERRLLAMLGASARCPHGNQINKSATELWKQGLQLLWEAPPASRVKVENMHERASGPGFTSKSLIEIMMEPSACASVRKASSWGKPPHAESGCRWKHSAIRHRLM